jgi:hypothetical protein
LYYLINLYNVLISLQGAILDADRTYDYSPTAEQTLRIINSAIPDVFQQSDSVFNTYTVHQWLFAGVPLKCADADRLPSEANWISFCTALSSSASPEGSIRPEPDSQGETFTDFLYAYFYPVSNHQYLHDGNVKLP